MKHNFLQLNQFLIPLPNNLSIKSIAAAVS